MPGADLITDHTMSLECKTLRRMAECFGGQVCRRCGRPAERLFHNHFYCQAHRPRGPGADPAPRGYRLCPGGRWRP